MMSLRVVSYNVRGLRGDGAALARVLRELAPDVLCVQAAPKRLFWRDRCAAFARRTDLLYVGGGGTAGGAALFTSVKVDVGEVREHRLSKTPGLTRRGAVLARLAKAGTSFGIASIHLGADPAERARHLTDVTGLLQRLTVGAAVVAGDVNETPHTLTWSRLATHYCDAGAVDDVPTFPAENPYRRVDGVFVRGLEVRSFQVIDSTDVRVASDHRPVLVDLV